MAAAAADTSAEAAFTVEVLKSELRETDEIDKTAFTMYVLNVTRVAAAAAGDEQSWQVSRRYSQFDELRNLLCKLFPGAKSTAFPPKTTMGKLNPAVVERRTGELGAWVTAMLTHAESELRAAEPLLAFLEASDASAMVKPGAPAPSLVAQDIHGRTFDSAAHGDALIVYAAASRYNFQALEKFMKPSMDAIMRAHPALRCVIVSVADLRIVPAEARGMVGPVLEKVDSKNVGMTNKQFTDYASGKFNGFESYFIPDYSKDGEFLQQIGCTDANWTFRVFTVAGGKVCGSMQNSTKEIGAVTTKAFEDAIAAQPGVVAEWPDTAGGEALTVLQEGEVKVGARSKEALPLTLPAGLAGVGVEFNVKDGHSSIQFALTGAEGAKVLPTRTCECKEAAPFRVRASLPAGSAFEVVFQNDGRLRGKTVRYKVIAAPLPSPGESSIFVAAGGAAAGGADESKGAE
jgi:hypothetical protein